jgi:hypothetical protein
MPVQITISQITGSSPYDVYLCDDPITSCFYIDTITSIPYTFNVPAIVEDNPSFNLKIVDSNECEFYKELTVIYP